MKVKRIGSYLNVDKEGFLINSAKLQENPAHWLKAIEAVKDLYLTKWGDIFHSIYIRGSLAKGLALEGISDIDSFAVIKKGHYEPIKTLDYKEFEAWAITSENVLKADFPFVAGLELSLEAFEDILDRANPFNSIIKTAAVCIYGENLANNIAPYKIDRQLAFQTKYFKPQLELFLKEFLTESEEDKLTYVPWLMRRFLRLGMELVMEAEQRYTRDLYLCYESFSKHYPEHEAQMYHALELAINPEIDDEMLDFAKTFGAWLGKEAHRKMLMWGYTQNDEGKWLIAAS